MQILGIVGGGPSGLYLAYRLLQENCGENDAEIHLFEKEDRVGGRARMDMYHDVHVVTGAGIVRQRDSRLIRLARRLGVSLHKFTTSIIYRDMEDDLWDVSDLHYILPYADRDKTFGMNMAQFFGKDRYRDFKKTVGAMDFDEADVIDTIMDYGFQDNLTGQIMYGIDWDNLLQKLLQRCAQSARFFLHLSTPISAVAKKNRGGFVLNGKWSVNELFWTAPRPSWDILPVQDDDWKDILAGMACQSFLRAYAIPKKTDEARKLYPTTTYMNNPLQRLIPYKDNVYMIAYCDNKNANIVRKKGQDLAWLHTLTGIQWTDPVIYYHQCGTHYFRPLNKNRWRDRNAFLRRACHPARHLYLCGEGLSHNQGWTEGALESVDGVMEIFCR
jgi:hypothetical protein